MSKLYQALRAQALGALSSPRASIAVSILTGAAAALIFMYALYRFEVPSNPFIYVAF